MWGLAQSALSTGDDAAPGDRVDRYTHADEAERALDEDDDPEGQQGEHDQRTGDVRENLVAHDPTRAGAQAAGRGHELPLGHRQGRAPGDASEQGDGQDADDERHRRDALPADRGQGHGQHERREGEHGVEHGHDHDLDASPEVPGDHPERAADEQADRHGHDPHDQRDPGAMHDARQHVAAVAVEAEHVLPARSLEAAEEVSAAGIGGPQRRGESDDHQEREPSQRQAEQHAPSPFPRAAPSRGLSCAVAHGGSSGPARSRAHRRAGSRSRRPPTRTTSHPGRR